MSTTDKMKNTGQDAKGKAKEAYGRVTGDRQAEAEGRGDQAAASLKKAGEKVKDAVGDAVDAVRGKAHEHDDRDRGTGS